MNSYSFFYLYIKNDIYSKQKLWMKILIITGRKNIWNQIEREAKELAFGVPSREVDEVLRSQDQDWFFKGPRQLPQQHQGSAVE